MLFKMNKPTEKVPVYISNISVLLVFGLIACQTGGDAHETASISEKSAAQRQPSAALGVPQTGLKRSYARGDDGDLQHGISLPDPRFTDHGNGTIGDRLTGLMWTKNADQAPGKVEWEDALAQCVACSDGGHKDWRLPNRNELASLLDLGQAQPALPAGHPFENVRLDYYWTSTTTANSDEDAWIVHFVVGFITHDDHGTSHFAWCVRD